MLNTMKIAVFLKAGILKFSSMITTDSHDRAILLNFNFLEQLLGLIKSIRFLPKRKAQVYWE
jgi:hypothetical protein